MTDTPKPLTAREFAQETLDLIEQDDERWVEIATRRLEEYAQPLRAEIGLNRIKIHEQQRELSELPDRIRKLLAVYGFTVSDEFWEAVLRELERK